MKFFQASPALFSAVNFKKVQGLFAAPNFMAQNFIAQNSRVQNFARNFNQGGENFARRAQNHINFKPQNFKTEREPWRA
ncbi:hypothetical protein [uncultured Campylobacter sp.]|uniref:hypothetical protein n=1 Tax=uncultured Campylobacter sp. TaxID=218934 RepID=UPI0026022ECB|nr:hypothetical protein [uncultured Campylobacter sp.]